MRGARIRLAEPGTAPASSAKRLSADDSCRYPGAPMSLPNSMPELLRLNVKATRISLPVTVPPSTMVRS
jgi:hypothetical protein